MIEKKNILGVGITNASQNEILEYIVRGLENFKKKFFLVTPNPEFLVLANKNSDYRNILNQADLASADGIGIIIASKILGQPLKGRLTGVDLVDSLCKRVSIKPITVGFLGGRSGVAEKTAECLKKKYPGLKVVFASEEWPNVSAGPVRLHPRPTSSVASLPAGARRGSPAPATRLSRSPESGLPRYNNLTIGQFNNGAIDILFVAFGAPKQEFWISENLDKIPVKIAIGVGGAFDYISGRVGRAPSWMQNIGLEWMYRLIRQPWRLKRQFSLLRFIWLVIKEKLSKSGTLILKGAG